MISMEYGDSYGVRDWDLLLLFSEKDGTEGMFFAPGGGVFNKVV